MLRTALVTLFLAAVIATAFAEEKPAPASAPAPEKLPEFGDVAVVAWDVVDKWSFGGDRFHKTNRFYQPVDPPARLPWVITQIDITTWFQQDVIDGFAPSFEPLIGEKWKELKKFMEAHKYGGSCHFVYVLTDKKLTWIHDQGKPKEQKFECDVLPDGMEKYFTGPMPEHFLNVDGMKKDEAYKIALERYQARLAWSAKVREAAGGRPDAGEPRK